MLRIEHLVDKGLTVLKLSGRLQEEYLFQLQAEMERRTTPPTLDLTDVTLVDRASVRFLIRWEAKGLRLVNSPLYVREWLLRERRRTGHSADSE